MAKYLTVTFAGGPGGTGVPAAGAVAGDRLISISRLDDPTVGTSLTIFGEFIPADGRIYQQPSGDLTGQMFVATLERQEP